LPHIGSQGVETPDGEVAAELDSTTVVPGPDELALLASRGQDLASFGAEAFTIDLRSYLRGVGVPDETVAQDFDPPPHTSRDLGSADFLPWLRKALERFILRYRLEVHEEWSTSIPVCFAEVHSPPRKGSRARLSTGVVHDAESSFTLTLWGSGGGSGRKFTFRLTSSTEVRDGRCRAVEVPVEVVVQKCSYSRGESSFPPFLRASPSSVGGGLRLAQLDPCRRCNTPLATLRAQQESLEQYDLRAASASEVTELALQLDRERGGRSVLGVDLPFVSTKLELVGEVRTRGSVGFEYSLPGGATYFAYSPGDLPFHCWTTS
jgi:hypothetical protein